MKRVNITRLRHVVAPGAEAVVGAVLAMRGSTFLERSPAARAAAKKKKTAHKGKALERQLAGDPMRSNSPMKGYLSSR